MLIGWADLLSLLITITIIIISKVGESLVLVEQIPLSLSCYSITAPQTLAQLTFC